MRFEVVIITLLLLWSPTVPASIDVSFEQKLYVAFMNDTFSMSLNFSNPTFHQSFQRLEFMVGEFSAMICEPVRGSNNPRCSSHNSILFPFKNVVIRENKVDVEVVNVTHRMGDKVTAIFTINGTSHRTTTDIMVLDEPICNASYQVDQGFEPPHRRTTLVVPLSQNTVLSENTAVDLECSVFSYHSSGQIPAFPSWKSSTAILLKVSSSVYHQKPVLSTQSARLVVNKISHFESVICEVQMPTCVPGRDGCELYRNKTMLPGGDDDDYIDYDDYENDDLMGEEVKTSSTCLRNSRKCKCSIKSPKLSYCSDEVNIIEEKLANSSVRLTCRVRPASSNGNFTSQLLWESSDSSFNITSESIIIVDKTATYRCIATLSLDRSAECEVSFKTKLDFENYTTQITEIAADKNYRKFAITGVSLFVLALLCVSTVFFVIKGVLENNRRAIKEMGIRRYPPYKLGSDDQNI